MNENVSVILDNTPAIRSRQTRLQSSVCILIALTPALIWSCVYLGMRSLLITLVCVLSCTVLEAVFQLVISRKTSVLDLSGTVTGVLVAFTFPVGVPLYIPIVSCFAVTVIKDLLGKYTKGVINPIILSSLFVRIVWKAQTAHSYLGTNKLVNTENITDHLPITAIQNGEIPGESIFDLFFGNQTGNIGTISVAMLLLGGIYLIAMKVISWQIPVGFLGSVLICTYLLSPSGLELGYTAASVCTGGVVFGAIFLATYSFSSPVVPMARLVFGIGCGLMTVFLRAKTNAVSDVAVAILIMSLLTPVLDTLFAPTVFGKVKKR